MSHAQRLAALTGLTTLSLLLACSGGGPDSNEPAGSTGDAGTGDEGTGGDEGGSTGDEGGGDEGGDEGGGDDTGEIEWISLAEDCTPPTASGTDPFVLKGSVKNTQEGGPGWFTEILDIVYQPELDRVLTTGQGGLVYFDTTDETDPITKGHEAAGGPSFERYYQLLTASDNLVWVTHREVGLDTWNVSDPDAFEQVSRVDGLGFEGLGIHGPHLYVASTKGTVEAFGVDDPTAEPEPLHTVEDLGRPWDVHVVGDVAYVADGELGLVVLDLKDPEYPVVSTTLASAGLPVRLDDGDGLLFMVSGAGGLEIFDISSPLEPVLLSTVDVGGSAQDVAYDDGLVGVVTQEAVVLLDVARAGTGADPQPFSYQETEQYAMTLDAQDGTWAVGDWNILGLWDVGEGPAPSGDLSADFVAFLDEAETRTLEIQNRGGATLELTGITVPEGVTAKVSADSLEPGETSLIALTWDATVELHKAEVCIATNDPGEPTSTVILLSGEEGEGRVIGQAAPDFSLQDLDGNTWRLSEQLGHPVVLAYFATW